MAQLGISEYRTIVLASGLVTREAVEAAEQALRAAGKIEPTADDLAHQLVEQGVVNRWQAQQMLAGRPRFHLGPYLILDSIGQGGMGQVFRAEHLVMGRMVAVKVLPRHKSTPEAVASFQREIRAQAQLDHENLVRALDAGHDGNVHYLVTEYVPGTDLRRLIRRAGRLSPAMAASIITQVARGLGHAHEKGLLHRDVKPGNVLVTPDGRAKISDLGLVGYFEGDVDDPQTGKIVGTADYLCPEQVLGNVKLTPASDIYSLGCTLYYAVTGKVPFAGGSTRDKARAHVRHVPLKPQLLNPDVDEEFADIILMMMAKDPAQRIATTAEVVERLTPWHDGGVPIAVPSAARGREIPTPPPIGQSPANYTPDQGDTQPSFVIATFLPHELGDDDSISQTSQGTFPMAAATEETQRSMSRIRSTLDHFERQGIPRSVSILIAIAAVVAAVCLAAIVAGY
ncbi:MAG: serine/threonine protein kinase [Pirellulales bacterium]|nr:serine/threonine protein kinase [Pirellulales bacterium]